MRNVASANSAIIVWNACRELVLSKEMTMFERLTNYATATLAALLVFALPCAAQGDKHDPAAIQFGARRTY